MKLLNLSENYLKNINQKLKLDQMTLQLKRKTMKLVLCFKLKHSHEKKSKYCIIIPYRNIL